VIGGLRVVLQTDGLAMIHGPIAQAFLALVVAVALLTSPRTAGSAPATVPFDTPTRGLTVVAAALVYAQIVFGALLTHAGYLALHLVGALAVFALVPIVTARLRRSGDPVAAPASRALLALLGAQLALGAGSYLARFSAIWIPGGQLTMLVLPVTHRLAGGLILAVAVALAVRVLASARPRSANPPAPGTGHLRLEPASRGPLQ
jgi:heme A synthase